jgi:hypothetical protein
MKAGGGFGVAQYPAISCRNENGGEGGSLNTKAVKIGSAGGMAAIVVSISTSMYHGGWRNSS